MIKPTAFFVAAAVLFSGTAIGLLTMPTPPQPAVLTTTSALMEAPTSLTTGALAPALSEAELTRQAEERRQELRHQRLRTYTLEVMRSYRHAVEELPVADYDAVASDIARAVTTEPVAAWPKTWAHDENKATLLTAIAYWEGSRYAAYVDDLSCVNRAWRTDPANTRLMHLGGNCDGGHAHSLLQIHPIALQSSPLFALCNKDAVDASRLGAMRCGLEMARRSLTNTGTLAQYTGESLFSASHPKADERLNFALKAVQKHPLPADDRL